MKKNNYKYLIDNIITNVKHTTHLETFIDESYEIMELMSDLERQLAREKIATRSQSTILYSFHFNIDSAFTCLLTSNISPGLRTVRTISEHIIILKVLSQHTNTLSNNFYNWLGSIDNNKDIKSLENEQIEVNYKKFKRNIRSHFKIKYNINNNRISKKVNQVLSNSYGWYYKYWDDTQPLTLKYIANQNNCIDEYKIFELISAYLHANSLTYIEKNIFPMPSDTFYLLILIVYCQSLIAEIVYQYILNKKDKYKILEIKARIKSLLDLSTEYHKFVKSEYDDDYTNLLEKVIKGETD